MFLGRSAFGRGLGVGEGQQLVDTILRMAGDDLGEDVAQVGLRISAVHLAGFDERGDDRPMLAAAIGAGEEMIFSPERNLAVILPISGRMLWSNIGVIHCTGRRFVASGASAGHRVSWYT